MGTPINQPQMTLTPRIFLIEFEGNRADAWKWGVVTVDKGIGHCSLSGRYVSEPVPWNLYLGDVNEAALFIR